MCGVRHGLHSRQVQRTLPRTVLLLALVYDTRAIVLLNNARRDVLQHRRYNHDELPALVYSSALNMAVEMGHLPPSTPVLKPLDLRRGVVLDGHTGNICVMDAEQRVVQSSHGFGSIQDARSLYGETRIEVEGQRPGGSRWWVMGTHFELPFQQLFQHGVAHIDQHEDDDGKRSQRYSLRLANFKDIVGRM